METTLSPPAASEFAPGDHICGLCETEEEYRAMIAPFVRAGLERGEKVLCLVDSRGPEEFLALLRSEGIDVEAATARGQLCVGPARTACVGGGSSPPGRGSRASPRKRIGPSPRASPP